MRVIGPPSPTAAQRRAALPTSSVWVTANAGTGKTSVLTDRVLRLLLEGAHPESILCLTFTKAAAAEMIERVERRLAAWAVVPEPDLAAELEALTGQAPDRPTLVAARELFARVLDLPRGLQIMTIHALCGALLRRFPIEAGLAPHFETIDERTAGELLREAREKMLAEATDAATPLGAALEVLAVTLAETTLSDALDQLIGRRTALVRLVGSTGLEVLLTRIREALGVEPGLEPPELIARACADDVLALGALRAAAEACAQGSAKDCERGATIAAWLAAAPEHRATLWADYKCLFLTAKGEAQANIGTKKLAATARDALRAEQARICAVEAAIKALILARRTEALLRVGWAVIGHYETLKGHRTALDFDDLIERTRDLLATGSAWVLFKLDQRVEHLLVDEAQDTSPAQWDIVWRLAEEFFAGDGQHTRARTLFVVGDEKQSIYSFQGADLAALRTVRDRLTATAGGLLASELLDLSFRSTRAVLDLVDAILALPEASAGVVDAGLSVRHDTAREDAAGLVELWPLASQVDEPLTAEPWPLPSERRPAETPQRAVAKAIARTIRGWLETGERLAATGRRIGPGDVMILLTRRGLMQEEMIRALKEARVPVAGADRLGLTSHLAVQDIVALGRAVLLPEDELTLACLLKSPLLGLDDDDLMRLCTSRTTPLLDRLQAMAEEDERIAAVWQRLAGWLRRADFMPPFEFYCHVLGPEGGRQRLLGRLGHEAAEPIEAFLGQALAYEEGHPASLEGFLHWLSLGDQELKRDPEAGAEAVRVLTVHGAKGLEAPIVFLADAGPHGRAPADRILWDAGTGLPFWRPAKADAEPVTRAALEAEDARLDDEQRRLLYVALTRARDRLYVTGWRLRSEPRTGSHAWHDLVHLGLESLTGVEEVTHGLGPRFDGPVLRHARGIAAAETAPSAAAPRAVPLPAWATAPAPAEPAPARPLAPSRQGPPPDPPAASPAGAVAQESYRRGLLTHRLLQLLPEFPTGDRPDAARRLLAAATPELPEAAREHIASEVLAVLTMPELAPAFAPGSRAEQAIGGMVGGIPVAGQIDRLAVTSDTVLLVDYKTNRLPPADVAATPTGYLRQLAAYRALLQELYPAHHCTAAIVWTMGPRLDILPAALLDRHRPGPPWLDASSGQILEFTEIGKRPPGGSTATSGST